MIPEGLEVGSFSQQTVRRILGELEPCGSLAFIGKDADLSRYNFGQLRALTEAVELIQIEQARNSPAAFVQYAFRHEETNQPIQNSPLHEEWHGFFDQHHRAILYAPVEHAKTQHAIGRAIWHLGKNPNRRIAIVSNTFEPHATKILSTIRAHIESNPRVKRVFPHLEPSSRSTDPWGQSRIVVERETIAKDPSVQALGVYGPINGSRLDGIILDDILNFENTRTPEQCQKLIAWLDAEVLTRVTEHGWIWWIGTPWHPADPMHEIEKRAGWESARYCAVENPDAPMDDWKPTWPEQFSVDRLKKVYDGTTPLNFARKYLCQVRMDAASRFQEAWIERAKELGKHYRMFDRQPHGPGGKPWPCFTGVDLGIGQKEGHDLTVIFTLALDDRKRKVVAEIQAGRWPAPEIVQRIHSAVFRFNSQVYVEDNAAQSFLVQWAEQDGLPIRGFTTTSGKKYDEHFGIESLAVEMRNGGWVIPSLERDEEVEAWVQEMLFYTPDAHTGDRLMAAWLARECARKAGAPMMRQMDTLAR